MKLLFTFIYMSCFFAETDSLKENEIGIKKEPISPKKPKRKALKEVVHPENKVAELAVKTASQKPARKIKQEKQSILNEAASNSSFEEMPPPTIPLGKPIKTEGSASRTTRARTRKNNKIETELLDALEPNRRDSDVILNNATITVLEISSDNESETSTSEKISTAGSAQSELNATFVKPSVTRCTRSKVKTATKKVENSNENQKRSRSPSTEESNNKTKTVKSKKTKRKKAEDTEAKTNSA